MDEKCQIMAYEIDLKFSLNKVYSVLGLLYEIWLETLKEKHGF